MVYSAEVILGDGKVISFETGKIAKQADGAVIVRFGDSIVLSTVVAENRIDRIPIFFH